MAKRISALTQNIFTDPNNPTTVKTQTDFGTVMRPRTHFFDFTPPKQNMGMNMSPKTSNTNNMWYNKQGKTKKLKNLAEIDYKKGRISAIHSIFDTAAENQNQMAIKPKPKTWMNRLFSSSRKSGGRRIKKTRKHKRRYR